MNMNSKSESLTLNSCSPQSIENTIQLDVLHHMTTPIRNMISHFRPFLAAGFADGGGGE